MGILIEAQIGEAAEGAEIQDASPEAIAELGNDLVDAINDSPEIEHAINALMLALEYHRYQYPKAKARISRCIGLHEQEV